MADACVSSADDASAIRDCHEVKSFVLPGTLLHPSNERCGQERGSVDHKEQDGLQSGARADDILRIVKLPEIGELHKHQARSVTRVLFVIDASGSMMGAWPQLVPCVSTLVQLAGAS